MTDNRLRVVFMGCPDFAVPALQTLAGDGMDTSLLGDLQIRLEPEALDESER